MENNFLPPHLRKYVVTQNYEKYTPVDQAVWRYILRQLRTFLAEHAHESYREGLEKTGIEVERIPKIEDISAKLETFGWRAIPVSGFIPPAAFMELQSLGVLPIASDMRTMDHLLYTPAPDIVHEAAGHAPILIHPQFAQYLRQYAQVAKKALLSKDDLALYEAIRDLSDLKENPSSTPLQIQQAEEKLAAVSKSITILSEASELSRMNWWTAEYGLIGDIKNPKIFGAGLLSSVGESRLCLSDKVKKIPLTVDCIKMGYDITEQQPQLFVTPDFATLTKVLDEMAEKMAFRRGGLFGLNKAIEAGTINTAELSSGLQISGQISEALITPEKMVAYLKTQGPTQISYQDKQLKGHDKSYHAQGFGTPIGVLKSYPQRCPSTLTEQEWQKIGLDIGAKVRLEYTSGVQVNGTVQGFLRREEKTLMITFTDARVEYQGQILFDPSWGLFDMALGREVTSVFGSPADREAYGEMDDFVAKRVTAPRYNEKELRLHKNYQILRDLREKNAAVLELENQLQSLLLQHEQDFPEDWLLCLEAFELALHHKLSLRDQLKNKLEQFARSFPAKADLIHDGLKLAGQWK